MVRTRLTKRELQVLEVLWKVGACSIRQIHDAIPAKLAMTTVGTVVRRLEKNRTIRCTERRGNAHIFEPVLVPNDVGTMLIDELLAMMGGRAMPMMARLVLSGKLTLEGIEQAKRAFEALEREPPCGPGDDRLPVTRTTSGRANKSVELASGPRRLRSQE